MNQQTSGLYDLFISYTTADREWVEGYLFDALRAASVRYFSNAAFQPGTPQLIEFERGVRQSKRTLLVLSPAYLSDSLAQFVDILAQSYGVDTGAWSVIPLILQPVTLPPRIALLTPLDATDSAAWNKTLARLFEVLQSPVPEPTAKPPCPYPGMAPFREANSDYFFGREAESSFLVQQLYNHPFIAIIGPSGSGKSSLVFAGLLPALQQSTLFGPGIWTVRTMRPGEHPLEALQNALAISAWEQLELTRLVASITGAQRLLLVVDQFEELFTVGGAEAVAFLQRLQHLMGLAGCYVILTVRADFYSDLMTSSLWDEIRQHRLEITPLGEEELRHAIVRPAERAGVYLESALVERLLANAAGEPGVLPFVQEVLVLLWEKLQRRFLPLHAYEALVLPYTALTGEERTGLQVAMAQKADAIFSRLTLAQQSIAYPPENVNLLLDGQATQVAIRQALADLAALTNRDSTVLLYISCHGAQLTQGKFADEYLLPVDTQLASEEQLVATAIASAEFATALTAIPARKLFVVLDCCHAAGIGILKDAAHTPIKAGLSPIAYERLAGGQGRALLSSSDRDEKSYILPGARNSLFTHHLLAGLRGGVASEDGLIRLFDLFEYVQPRVTADHHAQHPVFKADLRHNFPVALRLAGQPKAVAKMADGFVYDAYLSFTEQEPDAAWVWTQLIPALEKAGLQVAVSGVVQEPGVSLVLETERAIRQAKRTVIVLSPAYLADHWTEFDNLLAQTLSIQEGTYRLLPLKIAPLDNSLLPTRLSMLTTLDLTHSYRGQAMLERLIQALQQPLPTR
ncbi:MAG: TIR domain-containing protein [Caldilineaceae bacterium]|nr:TIR domain-containing protein [Caldilineaceae bacterium]